MRILVPGAALALMLVIALLSLIPGRPTEGDSALVWALAGVSPRIQNLGHVILYGLLTMLWVRWLSDLRSNRPQVIALMITITFGVLLELGQLHVPGRFGSVYDALLNTLGAMVGVSILRVRAWRAAKATPGNKPSVRAELADRPPESPDQERGSN